MLWEWRVDLMARLSGLELLELAPDKIAMTTVIWSVWWLLMGGPPCTYTKPH